MIMSTGTVYGLAYHLGKQNDCYVWQETFTVYKEWIK